MNAKKLTNQCFRRPFVNFSTSVLYFKFSWEKILIINIIYESFYNTKIQKSKIWWINFLKQFIYYSTPNLHFLLQSCCPLFCPDCWLQLPRTRTMRKLKVRGRVRDIRRCPPPDCPPCISGSRSRSSHPSQTIYFKFKII